MTWHLFKVFFQHGIHFTFLIPQEKELDIKESQHDHDQEDDYATEWDDDQETDLLVGKALEFIKLLKNFKIWRFQKILRNQIVQKDVCT